MSSRRARAVVAALALVGACGDEALAPFEPEIGNVTDSFQFQVTALDRVSTTVEYEWQHTGSTANVNQSTSLSAGTAILVIRDAQGTVVHQRTLTDDGTFQTSTGAAGRWRIRVELSGASGAVNFRVQKRTP